jgi:hypothetical protein
MGLSQAVIYPVLYIYACVICDVKLCVNYTELGNGARRPKRGNNGEIITTTFGVKNGVSNISRS